MKTSDKLYFLALAYVGQRITRKPLTRFITRRYDNLVHDMKYEATQEMFGEIWQSGYEAGQEHGWFIGLRGEPFPEKK